MACKTKSLKLRKYSTGSQLPKKDGIIGNSYLDENATLYTPNAGVSQPESSGMSTEGALGTIGAIGTTGAALIDATKTKEQQMYTDSGASWSQSLVSSAGPWGSAISGVSQLGTSALESTYDYDEYGYVENEDWTKIGKSLETGLLDPAQNLNVAFSDEYTTGERIGAALLPGLAGIFETEKEQEEAIERKRTAETAKDAAMLAELNRNIRDYNPIFKYGGHLAKKANGGTIEGEENDLKMKLFKSSKPNVRTAYYTPNELRPRTKRNTIDTLISDFGMTREEAVGQYSKELLDSIAGTTPRYVSGVSSIGEPVLNEYIPNIGKKTTLAKGGFIPKPIARKYGGQTHEGPDEGVRVDSNGNPTSITGNRPVALTEKNEVVYNGYVFSDQIKYK